MEVKNAAFASMTGWSEVMDSIEICEARAKFLALVEAAERGRRTTITRCGRPAAVLVPVEDAHQLDPDDRPSFADLLLAYPGGLEFERDPAPLRDVKR